LNTLLHRKRGAYGPLWIFELDPETWAIVWSGWLEDDPQPQSKNQLTRIMRKVDAAVVLRHRGVGVRI
jgi:hypothetical protein